MTAILDSAVQLGDSPGGSRINRAAASGFHRHDAHPRCRQARVTPSVAHFTSLLFCLLSALASPAQIPLLSNGDFESGLSSWVQADSFYSWNNSARAHGGAQYAYFGVGTDGYTGLSSASGSIYQPVYIPFGATSTNLTYWLWVTSDEFLH